GAKFGALKDHLVARRSYQPRSTQKPVQRIEITAKFVAASPQDLQIRSRYGALRGDRQRSRTDDIFLQDVIPGVNFNQSYIIGPQISQMLQHAPGVSLVELGALHHDVAQHQPAIAGEIDIDHFDIRIDIADVILPREFTADAPVPARVVNRIDLDAGGLFGIVVKMKHPPISYQLRRQKLGNETLIAIIGPDLAQHAHDIAFSGDVRKPLAILLIGFGNDALDILHHRKAECIGIEVGEARIVEFGLEHHIGVGLQEFKEVAVGEPALLVQAGHDAIVHVSGGAFVHDLGLGLRIKILRDVAHDAQNLALPWMKPRRALFQEVENIFLRQPQELAPPLRVERFGALRKTGPNGPPQIVGHALLVPPAFLGAVFLGAKIEILLSRIAVDAMGHQRMRGVERDLDR